MVSKQLCQRLQRSVFNNSIKQFHSKILILDITINAAVITQQQQYRAIVLKDLIESEVAHVTELLGLVNNFLHPLEKSAMYVLKPQITNAEISFK